MQGAGADQSLKRRLQKAAAPESEHNAAKTQPRFESRIDADDVCRQRLRTGKTDLIVAVGPVVAGKPHYDYVFESGAARKAAGAGMRLSTTRCLQRAAGRPQTPVITVQNTLLNEPGARYIDFLVPGLLGMSLMGGGLWGVGYVTVDMRIRKLLKRFLATPMKRRDFLAGIMISRLLFMVPEVLVLLVCSCAEIGVRRRSSRQPAGRRRADSIGSRDVCRNRSVGG